MPRKSKSRSHRTPEGAKISKLVREGVPRRQAIAESLSMKRAGRLTKHGGYIRSKHSRSRRSMGGRF